MNNRQRPALRRGLTTLPAVLAMLAAPVFAQFDGPAQTGPAEIVKLVSAIAMYPEPVLQQVLQASTYWEQIPAAARFADANRSLHGDAPASAYAQANLKLDSSVESLIAVPDVLDMMAGNMNWTSRLGTAVLFQRDDVMGAVQQIRAATSVSAS
jgi:hypothetical protein